MQFNRSGSPGGRPTGACLEVGCQKQKTGGILRGDLSTQRNISAGGYKTGWVVDFDIAAAIRRVGRVALNTPRPARGASPTAETVFHVILNEVKDPV
jgi:hypothetical protein